MASAKSLARQVRDMADDLDDEIDDAVESGTEDMETEVERQIELRDLVVHGTLLASVGSEEDPTITPPSRMPNPIVGTFNGYDISYRVFANAPHAGFVEYGTGLNNEGNRPETSFKGPDPQPPFGPIFQWVLRKGFSMADFQRDSSPVRYQLEGGGFTVDPFHDDLIAEPQNFIHRQMTMAWNMVEYLGKEGNQAHPFMRPAYRATKGGLIDDVEDAVDDTIKWSNR